MLKALLKANKTVYLTPYSLKQASLERHLHKRFEIIKICLIL